MTVPPDSAKFSAARRLELILLFGVLTTFTPIAVDMYLPALPAIGREFHATTAAIEHSMAAYFLGLTIGQAAVGPLSDRFGRKIPLLVGMGFYVLGSIACALSTSPIALDVARCVQAMGGCAGTVLARACVRDMFPPNEASRIFAQMLLVLAVSPLFAPLFGGWLLLIASWHWMFWIQGGLAALAMVATMLRLPESHPGSNRAIHPVAVLRDYWYIGSNPRFLGYVASNAFSGAGIYIYLTGWSHVVIEVFHIAPQYFGYTMLLNGIGLIISSQAVSRLLRHRPAPHLLLWALILQTAAGCMAVLFGYMGWGGLLGLLPWLFIYCAQTGAVNPTAAGLALMGFGESAGMASALLGIVVYGGGVIASMAMGAFNATSPVPMTGLMLLTATCALCVNLYFRRVLSRTPSPKNLPG